MATILKRCFITILVAILQSQVAKADPAQNPDELLFSPGEKVLLEELENARGREGVDITTLNNQNIRATLHGNEANNNVNGANMIDGGSFAGASGFTSIIQNSGNNVIIQDSTILNVTITP